MSEVEALLDDIRTQLETLPDFGQLQLHIKRHVGKFSNTDVVKMTSVKFSDNEPNVSATTQIYHLIKAIADSDLTGTLSFSLNFKHGQAEQMTVQDFKKL